MVKDACPSEPEEGEMLHQPSALPLMNSAVHGPPTEVKEIVFLPPLESNEGERFSEPEIIMAFLLLTVTLQVAVFHPSSDLAVIMAVPAANALTVPLLTLAIEPLLLLHITA